MRKIILYIAQSLNGKIARADGGVDWLENIPNPEKSDYGYTAFYDSVDTTIQGYNTYEQVINWGIEFPYADKKNYVLSRKPHLTDTEHATFILSDHITRIKEIKAKEGKNIWLIGGGQINTMLFNAGLIDEVRLFIMPIVIPDGIGFLAGQPMEKPVKLLKSNTYPNGAVELIYKPIYNE